MSFAEELFSLQGMLNLFYLTASLVLVFISEEPNIATELLFDNERLHFLYLPSIWIIPHPFLPCSLSLECLTPLRINMGRSTLKSFFHLLTGCTKTKSFCLHIYNFIICFKHHLCNRDPQFKVRIYQQSELTCDSMFV